MKATRVFGKRILVVEDDPGPRTSLELLLKIDRHQVRSAANGHEALEFLAGETFDIVLLDYAMPDIQGGELAQMIKQAAPLLPILMVTAFAEKLGGSSLPVDAILSKPFGVEDLRATIARLVG
jgi:two-component system, OmpR family, response regulator MprA